MNDTRQKLLAAEKKAADLFQAVYDGGLIVPGKTEQQLNEEVVKVAYDVFGVDTFWHKKIVRAGVNTMCPYSADPPDLVIQDDDIVILDFGPVFNGYEADFARTYIIGDDPNKRAVKAASEAAWEEANAWYNRQTSLTGARLFTYLCNLARQYGYEYGGEIGGHIVGPYPHEQLGPGNLGLDIHPDNHQEMFLKDPQGNDRHWVLEMLFVDRKNQIGGYMEQLIVR